jgi:hypothetical protein
MTSDSINALFKSLEESMTDVIPSSTSVFDLGTPPFSPAFRRTSFVEPPWPKIDQAAFIRHHLPHGFRSSDKFLVTYGASNVFVMPTVSKEEWEELVKIFPGLAKKRCPSSKYNKLQFFLSELDDDKTNLRCTLLLRPTYSMEHGQVTYDRTSREYSISAGDKLLARTIVTENDECEWQYINGGFFSVIQPLVVPTLLVDHPNLIVYADNDQLLSILPVMCQCFDCCTMDSTVYPTLFEESEDMCIRSRGLVQLLRNCNACRRRLQRPSFDIPISLRLRFGSVVYDINKDVSTSEPPPSPMETTSPDTDTERQWYSKV